MALALGQGEVVILPYVVAVISLIAIYLLLREVAQALLVKQVLGRYSVMPAAMPGSSTVNTSINLALDSIDSIKPVGVYEGAKLFIATFDHYQHTKNGKYLKKQTHYKVLELQLSRNLPHILFDSRKAKGRQFKYLYLDSQRISVQGTFDLVFDTYAPQSYAIDSLSFVSPEVMEVLVEAQMSDIEILGDKVYLYAPLLGKENTDTFVAKGQAIARHLNDNIDTYHDNRLYGDERKTTVTPFARTLLKSPRKYQIVATLLLFVIIGVVLGAAFAPNDIKFDILFNGYSVFVYIVFVINAWSARKIMRENRKATERFRILHQTNRGK